MISISRVLKTGLFAAGALLVVGSLPVRAETTQDAAADARRINEIIEGLERPAAPRTRGLGTRGVTRGPKKDATHECGNAIMRAAGTTIAAKKDLDDIRDCVEDSPKMDFEINFAFNSAQIEPSAMQTLSELGRALENEKFSDARFVLAGHTDAKGGRDYNMALSKRRADAVRAHLIENYRISGRQLVAIGYGFESLKDPGRPYADENRRVEVIRTH